MKKISLVLILALAILYANAQNNKTTPATTTTTKTTTTQPSNSTRTPLKVADLPKAVQDDLAKSYAGYTTRDAFKLDKNNTITYKVIIEKDTNRFSLVYDNNGKFLNSKSISQKPFGGPRPVQTNPTLNSNTAVGAKNDSIKK